MKRAGTYGLENKCLSLINSLRAQIQRQDFSLCTGFPAATLIYSKDLFSSCYIPSVPFIGLEISLYYMSSIAPAVAAEFLYLKEKKYHLVPEYLKVITRKQNN